MSSAGEQLPLVMTASGPQPTPPMSLLAALLTSVASQVPDYTSGLPGSLIEDVSSTQVGGLAQADSARVEAINSLSPFGANPFILSELGEMFGCPIGEQTNTSVYVQFTGPSGYVVPQGFLVGDGVFTYQVIDGGTIGGTGTGQSGLLFAVATIQGSWAVPAGTVENILSSLPQNLQGQISVTNPSAGTPGVATGESISNYRARIFQAFLASSQGTSRYLKTLLGQVEGVQQRLISVRQQTGGWQVLCGGGDPYQVAGAIFQALFDLNTLVGSTMSITNITKAANAQVTTLLNHGLTAGETDVKIADVVGMTEINGGPYTVVSVVDEKNFTLNVDSTGFSSYVSGGVVTPNNRNISVNISDPPDVYEITFVNPPAQTVTIDLSWNTNSSNFVSQDAVAQLGAPALADYINSIPVGQPINLFVLQEVFQLSIATLLDPTLLTVMDFQVNINGIDTLPVSGTGIINGDPESYFIAEASGITITQA